MSELTAKRAPRQVLLNVAAILFAGACVLVYFRIFSMELPDFLFPDETAAFDVFLARGIFGGIWYYWQHFIGRPGAMAWLGMPIVLSHRLGINPWHAVVCTRAFNFIVALTCLTLLLKTVLSRLGHSLSLAFAALLLSACLTGIGTTAVKYYWLVDQAIYLFSFMTYCLVLLLFWRIARNGIDKYAWWLPPVFCLYLGAHEVNLVAGGLMLALYFVALFDGGTVRLGVQRPVFWIRGHAQDKLLLSIFVALCVAYAVMAYLEVFSPSLGFRFQFFSVEKSWWEAAKLGFPAGFFPLLELGLGLKGSVLPILLTGGVLGAWHGSAPDMDRRRMWLLLCPLGFAILISVLMGVLSSRYLGLMDPFYNFPDAKIFPFVERHGLISLPVRQNIYAYQLWFTGLFFGGAAIGMWAARQDMVSRRKWLLPLASLLAVAWLTAAVTVSPAFADAWHFDFFSQLGKVTEWLSPLSEPPGFDGTRYLEEPPPEMYAEWGWDRHPIGHPKGTTYPLDTALQGMFLGGPIMFVPCGVAGARAECNDDDIPRLERRLDSAVAGLSGVWSTAAGGRASLADGRLAFVEDKEDGEHYLATGQLAKSARTLVQVTAIIDAGDVATGTGAVFNLVSPDGSAAVAFDLAQAKISGHTESDARALDGSIRRLAGASLSRWELTARFVVFGKADQFQVRLQSSRNGQTVYQGNGRSSWQVESSRIRMLDTGPSVAGLKPKLGGRGQTAGVSCAGAACD